MQDLLHGLQEMIIKTNDVKQSPPWDEFGIMKEQDHLAIVKVTFFCILFPCTTGNIRDRICDCLIRKILLVKLQIRLPASPWTQDINWMCIRHSEDVRSVFCTSSVCRVYVILCLRDLYQSKAVTMTKMISIKPYAIS